MQRIKIGGEVALVQIIAGKPVRRAGKRVRLALPGQWLGRQCDQVDVASRGRYSAQQIGNGGSNRWPGKSGAASGPLAFMWRPPA